MGIPSVKREVHSYLTDTLNSLISELNPQEKEDSVIVVLIAEGCQGTDYLEQQNALRGLWSVFMLLRLNERVVLRIKQSPRPLPFVYELYKTPSVISVSMLHLLRFPNEIHSGLLEVISPSPHFYPDFSRLRESFGDPKERVRWRTKQNLDYCFLMMYAQSKGIYYVQLEDDIVAKPNYLSTMKNFALQQPSEEWMILEFSQLGFIGKMFKSLDLSLIVEFILMFYKDKPIDWLLDHILWVKVCNPEKDATESESEDPLQTLTFPTCGNPLLPGRQNTEAKSKANLFSHLSPDLSLIGEPVGRWTKILENKLLEKNMSTLLQRFFFRSGNIEHPEDKLFNTTVEVLPFDSLQSDKEALQEGRGTAFKYRRTSDGYIQIEHKEGMVTPELPFSLDSSAGQI
ncbi:UNVERIFIED_CONTAM: hypothetical protein K2H54_035806 [Gekko kuhli]